jgi:tetratricopeptide (TPR) repeat protein
MKTRIVASFSMVLTVLILSCSSREDSSDISVEAERMEPWEEFGRIAEDALRNQNLAVAEVNLRREIDEFNKMQHPASSWLSFYALSRIYSMQGNYTASAEALSKGFDLYRSTDLYTSYTSGGFYLSLSEIQMNCGNYELAEKCIQEAFRIQEERDRVEPHNAEGKFYALFPAIGNLRLEQGEYERAMEYWNGNLDSRLKNPADRQDIAIAQNGLGMIHYFSGDDAGAERLFSNAVDLNGRAFVTFEADLALSLTMLGRIAANHGKDDQALENFHAAIKSTKSFEGYRIERSDVWIQIGRFHVNGGDYEMAWQAYTEAIRLRKETTTTTHPNCADAIKGLADVSAAEGDLTSATLYAEEALKILDDSVVPTHPRIAAELVALASIHVLAEHPEQAAPLNERIETILEKPLGPWKEDFLDTTAFYADLLEKAGKPDDAEALRQLHARQKDKR